MQIYVVVEIYDILKSRYNVSVCVCVYVPLLIGMFYARDTKKYD